MQNKTHRPSPRMKKGPIRTPVQAGHVDKNPRRENVEAYHPRSSKNEHSSGILYLATCIKGQDTEED